MRTIPVNRQGYLQTNDTILRGRYYGSNYHALNYNAFADVPTYTPNRLYAVSFFWGGLVATQMDRLGFFNRIGVSGIKGRCGIYNSLLDRPFPGQLYVGGSEFDLSASGTKEEVINFHLKGGRLYFAAFISDGLARLNGGSPHHIVCGSFIDGSGGCYLGTIFYKDTTYGSLPDTFPSDALPRNSPAPIIEWRVA